MNLLRKRSARLLRALLPGLLLLAVPHYAQAGAACVPGLPCVTPKTANPPGTAVNETNAGPNADKLDKNMACDADFMNQIYARAFLEASRENIMNEVLIRRPDSVMEYTCFDNFIKVAGADMGDIFSESTRWQIINVPIAGNIGLIPIANVTVNVFMGAGRLNNDLNRLVLTGLAQYISDAFPHTFLGRGAGPDYAPSGPPYSCSFMDSVYFMARCNDMNVDDPFLSFRTLVATDPRQLPDACVGGTKITDPVIDVSENVGFNYVTFDTVNPAYINFLLPGPCLPPIPTGITVIRHTRNVDLLGNVTIVATATYPDKVCPNPSCYYDNGGGGRCVP